MSFLVNPYTFGAPQEIINFDLSTTSGWTFVGSTIGINTGSEYLYGDSDVNDARGTSEIQSGFTLSDTKWIARMKYDIVTYTSPATNNNGQLYFGFTDQSNATGVLGSRDGLGIIARCGSGASLGIGYADNSGWYNTSFTGSSAVPSVTTYYAQLQRSSSTSANLKFYSDSGFSSLVDTVTQSISATLTGLNYITLGSWDHASLRTVGVQISDIVIYDNYSSVP